MTQYLEIDANGVATGGVYNAYDGNVPSNWIAIDPTQDCGIGYKWDGVKWTDPRSYVEKRQDAYPGITEQLDMMYWDAINNTTVWKDAIAKVKLDIPKE